MQMNNIMNWAEDMYGYSESNDNNANSPSTINPNKEFYNKILKDILIRYRQLGGELITIGSDAHLAGSMCNDFPRLEALLLECGFKYHAIFKERKPVLYPLG